MSPLILLAFQTLLPTPTKAERAWAYSQAHGGQTMLVMQGGKSLFERYGAGGAEGRAQMLASGSKSFVGVAAMAAVQDGLIWLKIPRARPSPSGRPTRRSPGSPTASFSR